MDDLFEIVTGRYRIEVSPYVSEDVWLHNKRDRNFWKSIQEEYNSQYFSGNPRLYTKFYHKVYNEINKEHVKEKNKELLQTTRHYRMMGVVPVVEGGEVVWYRNQIKYNPGKLHSRLHSLSESQEDNSFVESIPYSIMGSFIKYTDVVLWVKDINFRLKSYYTRYPPKTTKSHHGVSLGYTVV
jgi:hypothetical protein